MDTKETHVDDFVQDMTKDRYARWVLFLHRLPALLRTDFAEQIAEQKLFADWKGRRYRVTGASRLGDVWLASNFNQEVGYDHRVSVDELSNFAKEPRPHA